MQTQSAVNLNTIDSDALARHLGIHSRLARRIVSLRPYTSLDELSRVWGLDAATLARIRPLLIVHNGPQPSVDVSSPLPQENLAQVEAAQIFEAPAAVIHPDRLPPTSDSHSPGWRHILVLVLILAVGAYFRFVGLNWDENTHQQPDERFITMVAEDIQPVGSLGEYFDTANSTLNPLVHGSYTYGMLPLFLTRSVGEIVNKIKYDDIVLVGRALSGLFDLAAVFLLYLLGARLYNRKVGLLAAALAAAAVLPIQLSHYLAVDSFSTVFVVGAFLLALQAVPIHQPGRSLTRQNWVYFGLFGLVTGLAMACKVNTAPVFGLVVLAGIAYLASIWKRPAERKPALRLLLVGWLLAALGTALAFRIFQPYAFAGPGFFGLALNPRWLSVIREVTNQVAGYSEWPPNHHWTARPISYAWVNMVVWGLGLPLGLAAWGGWGWAAWRVWKGDWRQHFLPVVWVGAYFVWQNAQFWRYMRYFIPIYPLVLLLGAWALVELFERTRESRSELYQPWQKSAPFFRSRAALTGKPGDIVRQSISDNTIPGDLDRVSIQPGSPGIANGMWARLHRLRPVLPGALAGLAMVVVVASAYIYAFVFTRLYTQPITRVQASRWIIANIPAPINVIVDTAQGQVSYPVSTRLERAIVPGTRHTSSIIAERGGRISRLSFPRATIALADLHIWITQETSGSKALSDGHLMISDKDIGEALQVPLREVTLEGGVEYTLKYTLHTSGSFHASGFALKNDNADDPVLPLDWELQTSQADDNQGSLHFTPGKELSIDQLVLGEVEAASEPRSTTLQVWLARDEGAKDVLSTASLMGDFTAAPGDVPVEINIPPAELEPGGKYYVIYELLEGGPLMLRGDDLALETRWDDSLPLAVDDRPVGGMYDPLVFELYEPDTERKLERMLEILDKAEYLVSPSNRAYDAMPRLPLRYPLTTRYYQALFDCDCTGDAMEARANALRPPFHSSLGFDLVASFEHPFDFGLFQISDLSADEAFTVYDHPKVMIFQKSADFSLENARAILGSVDLTQVIDQAPIVYTRMPTGLRLPADRLEAQRQGGTWSDLFRWDALLNRYQWLGVLTWYLLLMVLGWFAFPLVSSALRGLPDLGYPLARFVALAFVAWLSWLLASLKLVPATPLVLWLCVTLLVGLSYIFFRRQRARLFSFLQARWRTLLGIEGLFFVLFLASLALRAGYPDLWQPWTGGEKPMDFAFFNAILKAAYYPPEHPWFAGNYINYYYYGLVIASVLTKLLGIVPSIAYNLVLPTWFAMTGVGVFSIAHNLIASRDWKSGHQVEGRLVQRAHWKSRIPLGAVAGLAAVILMLGLGNLYQVRQLVKYLPEVAQSEEQSGSTLSSVLSGAAQVLAGEAELPGDKSRWYFAASRPILHEGPDTPIAEFPLFSFLYADLHPHVLAMPALFACLAWMLSRLHDDQPKRRWPEEVLFWGIGGLVFGLLRPAHTWDYPTFLGMAVLALFWDGWRRNPVLSRQNVMFNLGRAVLLVILATWMYFPFGQWFGTQYSSFELWMGARTPLGDYLTVHGLFLFLISSFLLVESLPWFSSQWLLLRSQRTAGLVRRLGWRRGLLVASILLLAGVGLEAYPALVVGLPLLAWIVALFFRRGQPLHKQVVLALAGVALAATLLVEVVVLRGDVGRNNMVFRYYNQAWALFAVSSAVMLALLLADWVLPATLSRNVRGWVSAGRALWVGGLCVIILAAATYPLTAIQARLSDRWPGMDPDNSQAFQLDGMAYMLGEPGDPAIYDDEGRLIYLASDYAGIRWMQEHVTGTPVIVEGHTTEYRWGARYSVYTGLPAVVGWNFHVRQHNSILPGEMVEKRIQEVIDFYNTADIDASLHFLNRYQVSYVIVGDLERGYYTPEGLAKFPEMVSRGLLEEAFTQTTNESQISIYRVRIEG